MNRRRCPTFGPEQHWRCTRDIAQSLAASVKVFQDLPPHARVPESAHVALHTCRSNARFRVRGENGGDVVDHGDEMLDSHASCVINRHADL
jgi:hypothetical protein